MSALTNFDFTLFPLYQYQEEGGAPSPALHITFNPSTFLQNNSRVDLQLVTLINNTYVLINEGILKGKNFSYQQVPEKGELICNGTIQQESALYFNPQLENLIQQQFPDVKEALETLKFCIKVRINVMSQSIFTLPEERIHYTNEFLIVRTTNSGITS